MALSVDRRRELEGETPGCSEPIPKARAWGAAFIGEASLHIMGSRTFQAMADDVRYRVTKTRDARFDGRLFVAVKTTASIAARWTPDLPQAAWFDRALP